MKERVTHFWQGFSKKKGRKKRLLLLLLLLLLGYCSYNRIGPAATITIDLPLEEDVHDFVEDLVEQGATFRNSIDDDDGNPPGTVTGPRDGTSGTGGGGTQQPQSDDSGGGGQRQPSTGGGQGTGGGGSTDGGGSGGGTDGGSATGDAVSAPPSTLVVTVKLVNDNGLVLYPKYHFDGDTAKLVLDERRAKPGFYTLEITSTDTATGVSETVSQEFAWGVLALNTDKDRYRPGETSEIHIGVLDVYGEIVCNADLTLTITDPDGVTVTLKTSDGTIEITGTCGLKEGGLLIPDYRTAHVLSKEGTYTLSLQAVTTSHTTILDSDVQVIVNPKHLIKRTAATRLWPFAPSTMTIDIEFVTAFSGSITDVVPDGFQIVDTTPTATIVTDADAEATSITWTGSFAAGETATVHYTYDAPDVSPEFYLLGPIILASNNGDIDTELRAWQIANDAASSSTNYRVTRDVIAAGGGEDARSSNYKLSDTIGEPGAGYAISSNYTLEGGYRHGDDNFLSISCFTNLDIGTIAGNGQATGEASCTIIADHAAGYSLAWQVRTGSGGTSTGYMINQLETTINPFTPAAVGVPEAWAIAATTSEWGARLKSDSTDTDSQWGTDTVDEKWLNVGSGSSFTVVTRSSRTAPAGSTQNFQFRAEIGSNKVQQIGTYEVLVDFIATSPP